MTAEHSEEISRRIASIRDSQQRRAAAQQAAVEARAAQEQRELQDIIREAEGKIGEVKPTIVSILEDLEKNVPVISGAPQHTIEEERARPTHTHRANEGIRDRLFLVWGNKAGLTQAERELIARYRERSKSPIKRLFSPRSIVSYDADYIEVSIDAKQVGIFGEGGAITKLSHDEVLAPDRTKLYDAFAIAIMRPRHSAASLHKKRSYK